MNNRYYIHRSDIKGNEWYLLIPLPKHGPWTKMSYYCDYIIISRDGELIDTVITPTNSTRIYNLPDFIQKLNEFRLFLLL